MSPGINSNSNGCPIVLEMFEEYRFLSLLLILNNCYRSHRRRTKGIIEYTFVLSQSTLSWGPRFLFSQWIPDLKTGSSWETCWETMQGIMTFCWDNFPQPVVIPLRFLLLVQAEQNHCWLPVCFDQRAFMFKTLCRVLT